MTMDMQAGALAETPGESLPNPDTFLTLFDIAERTKTDVSIGTACATLDRLEKKASPLRAHAGTTCDGLSNGTGHTHDAPGIIGCNVIVAVAVETKFAKLSL